MPSRREIREAVVQFLYCADLDPAAPSTELRDSFWQFVSGPGQRRHLAASLKLLEHLSQGRTERLAELETRAAAARPLISAFPEAASNSTGSSPSNNAGRMPSPACADSPTPMSTTRPPRA
jgi:hypothetical protein